MLSMLYNYSLLTEVRIPQHRAFVNVFRLKFAQKNRRFLRNGGSIF